MQKEKWIIDNKDGKWEADKDIKACIGCGSPFGMMTRKHHCRKCGKVRCSKCLPNKISDALVCKDCVTWPDHIAGAMKGKVEWFLNKDQLWEPAFRLGDVNNNDNGKDKKVKVHTADNYIRVLKQSDLHKYPKFKDADHAFKAIECICKGYATLCGKAEPSGEIKEEEDDKPQEENKSEEEANKEVKSEGVINHSEVVANGGDADKHEKNEAVKQVVSELENKEDKPVTNNGDVNNENQQQEVTEISGGDPKSDSLKEDTPSISLKKEEEEQDIKPNPLEHEIETIHTNEYNTKNEHEHPVQQNQESELDYEPGHGEQSAPHEAFTHDKSEVEEDRTNQENNNNEIVIPENDDKYHEEQVTEDPVKLEDDSTVINPTISTTSVSASLSPSELTSHEPEPEKVTHETEEQDLHNLDQEKESKQIEQEEYHVHENPVAEEIEQEKDQLTTSEHRDSTEAHTETEKVEIQNAEATKENEEETTAADGNDNDNDNDNANGKDSGKKKKKKKNKKKKNND